MVQPFLPPLQPLQLDVEEMEMKAVIAEMLRLRGK